MVPEENETCILYGNHMIYITNKQKHLSHRSPISHLHIISKAIWIQPVVEI